MSRQFKVDFKYLLLIKHKVNKQIVEPQISSDGGRGATIIGCERHLCVSIQTTALMEIATSCHVKH